MSNQKLFDKVAATLLQAESVEEFDDVIKILVLDRGVPILRRIIESKEESVYCIGRH
jgi:hypothetical protein